MSDRFQPVGAGRTDFERGKLTAERKILANSLAIMPQADVQAPQNGILDFVRLVRVRRKIIIGTTLIIVALVTLTVMQLTPKYTASATVLLDQRQNNAATTDEALTALSNDQPTVQNQVQIITSLELAGRVVDKLHLDQDPDFNPKHGTGWLHFLNPLGWFPGHNNTQAVTEGISPERSALLHKFLDGLTAKPLGLSTALSISYAANDPYKASHIANAVADAYVEDQLESKFQATQKATQWLSGRIQELAKQASAADSAVEQYKAEHHLSTPVNGVSVVEQQTADINSQLVLAKAALAEKQANYSSLLNLQRSGQAANSGQVLASPLIATLRSNETDLNRQIAQLSTKYLPSHPKILDLQAQKQNLEAKIDEEIQRVVESVHNDVSAAGAHVASLQGSLSELERQNDGQDESSVQLTALQSTATSTRSMYEAFLGRLNQTQDREGIQAPDARVISAAEIPDAASFPRKGLAIAISIPAGLMLGLMLAFLVERMDVGFRSSSQLEELLRLPVIATIPEIRRTGDAVGTHIADLVVDKPMSAFAEAARGMQLGLSLANIDRQPKIVLVTSSVPGEGKTTVATSLARIAAGSGLKTVIVDCDMRRPAATKIVSGASQNGLVEALRGTATLDQCLVKDPKSSAMVLPCLATPPNPSDVLTSKAMQGLIARLRDAFDFVVIDSPPVLPVNDAKILSRLVDTVLFVVRWEKTPREAAETAIRALNDAHATIGGVAMTRVDNDRFRYYNYGYQYYGNYGTYYSE
jgi:succinoglycan biosynthesis transport protein ExoP